MLKCFIKGEEGKIDIEANGTTPELMADITTLLKVMYEGVDCKEDFDRCLKVLVEEELYKKSEKEFEEINKNKKEELLKKLLEELFK